MSMRDYRLHIGAEILKSMEENDELPMPNLQRLSKTMMEFFDTGDYELQLQEMGSKWIPTSDYWQHNLTAIRDILRKENKFFEYVRENGDFKGRWQFTNKKEYKAKLKRESSDIDTRIDTYNERLNDSKWQLNLPRIENIPQITAS